MFSSQQRLPFRRLCHIFADLVPHAESSHQAQIRSAWLIHRQGSSRSGAAGTSVDPPIAPPSRAVRGHSTAAAIAEETYPLEDEPRWRYHRPVRLAHAHQEGDPESHTELTYDSPVSRSLYTPKSSLGNDDVRVDTLQDSKPHMSRRFDHDRPLSFPQKIRGLTSSEPFRAMDLVASLPQSDLSSLNVYDISQLIRSTSNAVGRSARSLSRSQRDICVRAIKRLRSPYFRLLEARPVRVSQGETSMSEVDVFLRLCLQLHADRIAVSIFENQLGEPHSDGPININISFFARGLIHRQRWHIIRELMSHLPATLHTSWSLTALMHAALALRLPKEAIQHWEQMSSLSLPNLPVAQSILLQARLQMGDNLGAREVYNAMEAHRETSDADVQIVMLEAQKMLGQDADLEEKIISDLGHLDISPRPELLQMILAGRLKDRDYDGAKHILDMFDWKGAGGVPPSRGTWEYLFAYTAQTSAVEDVQSVWHQIQSKPELMSDTMLARLVHAVARFEDFRTAFDLVETVLRDGEHPRSKSIVLSGWRIPDTRPGSATIAALAGYAGDWASLEDCLKLLRRWDIEPTERLMFNIMKVAERKLNFRASELASLATMLRKSFPNIPSDRLNTVLARSADRESELSDVDSPSEVIEAVLEDNTTPEKRLRRLIADLPLQVQGDDRANESSGSAGARKLLTVMFANAFRPSSGDLLSLMQAYIETNQASEVQAVMDCAKEHGCFPTQAMHISLIRAWGAARDRHKTLAAYRVAGEDPLGGASASRASSNLQTSASINPVIATAAIQSLFECQDFRAATSIVRRDLLRNLDETSINRLDDLSIYIAAEAFRLNGEYLEALELICVYRLAPPRSLKPGYAFQQSRQTDLAGLTPKFRKLVRRIRQYLRKKVEGESASGEERSALEQAQQMLDNDDIVRPVAYRRRISPMGASMAKRWKKLFG